jgi:hypothetical protein
MPGTLKRTPLECRNPRDYFAIFDSVETREADGRYAHFELVSCKCVDTYVRIKKNQNQVHCCLLLLTRHFRFTSLFEGVLFERGPQLSPQEVALCLINT